MNDMQEARADLWESIGLMGLSGVNTDTFALLVDTHNHVQQVALECREGEADILIEPLAAASALIAKYATPESLH